jgi:hypothetical protein
MFYFCTYPVSIVSMLTVSKVVEKMLSVYIKPAWYTERMTTNGAIVHDFQPEQTDITYHKHGFKEEQEQQISRQ